ncbi:MAG: helix-turn-helix domain-containing protein [Lachnospiraceae bacterium]|nr:helix-turn-helix domain-containing protein [Lachnospiraceae bacterium]
MSFGTYFRELRKSKRVTQKQIADAIGKTTMLISGIETSKNGPFSDEDLKVVANFLDLTDVEYKALLIQAANARGKLPPYLLDYISKHSGVYNLLEVLAKKEMDDASLKKIVMYVEEIE